TGWNSELKAQFLVSTIRGTVLDVTRLPVTGVEIKVKNLGTNLVRSVVSNENGDFEIADLLRGTYRLTATQTGFRTFIAENLILESNQIRRVDVTLELGPVASQVTVSADAAVIATDTAKIQGSYADRNFKDAPWTGDGRNPYYLLSS